MSAVAVVTRPCQTSVHALCPDAKGCACACHHHDVLVASEKRKTA